MDGRIGQIRRLLRTVLVTRQLRLTYVGVKKWRSEPPPHNLLCRKWKSGGADFEYAPIRTIAYKMSTNVRNV